MLELSVNAKLPAAITAAFKKIREMVMSGEVAADAPVHLVLEAGTYRELVRYNLSNPLVMEGAPGCAAADCIIQADNCEAFHRGLENRAVFALGPKATSVTLRRLSVTNTHGSSSAGLADAAEALAWNSATGTLRAEGLRLEGRRNTLYAKGYSWFKGCRISGDTDFIHGDADAALFEDCEVHVREGRAGAPAFAVRADVPAGRPGFVFLNCRLTAGGQQGAAYACRTGGQGGAATPKGWDSVAFINCVMDAAFNEELVWDNDRELRVYPRGNALTGIREYGTRVAGQGGAPAPADTTRRHIMTYAMTADDYYRHYASRYLVLKDTPFAPAGN